MLVAGENLVELLTNCLTFECGLSLEPTPKVLINAAYVGRSGGSTLRDHRDTSFPLVMVDASESNVLFVVRAVNRE